MLLRFLYFILPLALPTLIYIGYCMVERRRAVAAGAGMPSPWWVNAPWAWLVIGGVCLMALTLFTVALLGGSDRHSTYEPARVEDGRIVR